uniref:TrkH family potassium uptake protein n=1 Tax=Streptomyces chisholmiae TaxID=3075540 RepID=UPI00374DFDBB
MRHPAQVLVAAFFAVLMAGAGLLCLPVASTGPGGADFLDALFTSASAVCVTGLIVVDTPAHWSGFGQGVILVLIQLGGLGVMTFASLLVLLVSHRLRLRARLTAAAETKSLGPGDVRGVVFGVVKVSLLLEAITALVLLTRFATAYDEPLPRALWLGVFHAVSAFNNAGFALYSDNLMGFTTDPWICLPITFAVVAGGLGFPVLLELRRRWRTPRRWSLHTRIVVWATCAFIVGGSVFVTALEWDNPHTLGPLSVPGKLLAGLFQGVMPRTAGFNSVDIAEMNPATWLGVDVLMFVGGASAGTAGGIKITTFAVLLVAVYAEVRGEDSANIFHRRLQRGVERQALTVVLLGAAAVVLSTLVLLTRTSHNLDQSLFEVVSAFGTVGLSTGITADLPGLEQLLLIVLMFVGRLGPITVASALALRHRVRLYQLPEERPIIG